MPHGPTLIVGQIAQPTGMARVSRAIAGQLACKREVHVLGIDATARQGHVPGRQAAGWTLHTNQFSWDVYAEVTLPQLASRLRPQTILLYHDTWVVARMLRTLGSYDGVVAAYSPVDGVLLTEGLVRGLASLDGLALPTAFAQRQVAEIFGTYAPTDVPALQQLMIIPHGIELGDFRPTSGAPDDMKRRRVEARRALWPERPDLWHGWWVLNANRNQPRKRLDLTLLGFASFVSRARADARLYLHWGTEEFGMDVRPIARDLGIEDRLIMNQEVGGVTTRRLNLVYNATDVGVNTAIGEGWGLVAFEHAATGAPQVLPAHSACAEQWTGYAEMLPVRRRVKLGPVIEGGAVDPEDLADALTHLYQDREYYAFMAQRAVERVQDPALKWEAIGDRWHAWLLELEAQYSCQGRKPHWNSEHERSGV